MPSCRKCGLRKLNQQGLLAPVGSRWVPEKAWVSSTPTSAICECNLMARCLPSKQNYAGSNPVTRSMSRSIWDGAGLQPQ